ncbi:MAG: hypothetical protein QGD96_04665 [Anaerolineae bacterium]|nr:hypothetical protein [Anaerolineae bacterium]
MAFLLEVHSILRWVIVVIGFVALLKFLFGIIRKNDFGKMDRGLSAGFSGLMDLQVTLGFGLFFIIGFGDAGFSSFRIEHLVIMLIAAVAGHAPAMFKKVANKYAVALFAVLAAMVLIFIGVVRLPGGWSR